MPTSSLLLVGCGKMGSALLSRWQQAHTAGIRRYRVIEPAQAHVDSDHVHWFKSLDELPEEFTPGVVVFAIKPQDLPDVLPIYHERFQDRPILYVSIAAGKPLRFFIGHLGQHAHVVRAMPNTPALIGQAMTTLVAAPSVPAAAKNVVTQLMEAVGDVVWFDDEALMDAATALSGSGPAYVFLFLESLVKAGVACGLPEATARHLAVKTVAGGAALAAHSHDPLETLRRHVTSPGGTTEAALSVLLKDDRFETLLAEAVQKAAGRSRELKE